MARATIWQCLLTLSVFLSPKLMANEVKIRDLVVVRGVRTNVVSGLGLVIGLSGSGDSKKSVATNKAAANMLTRMGMKTDSGDVVAGNTAVVMVTGELPPFGRNGDMFDVRVSAIGDAKSLLGGTLVLTPMRAGNGEVFSVAQGSVITGQGSGGIPISTVASIPNGAVVERETDAKIAADGTVVLALREPDFTTNVRIADAINTRFKGFFAVSSDPGAVQVLIPPDFMDRAMEFVAEVEQLKVEVAQKAMVVVNERTGTVVMGSEVSIEPITISHGALTITVKDGKKTEAKSVVKVAEPSVGALVDTLNALGVKPQDLAAIIQSMHAAGALHAHLKFL